MATKKRFPSKGAAAPYRVLAPCKQCGHVRLVCRYKPAALCKTCSLENQRKVLAGTMKRQYTPADKR